VMCFNEDKCNESVNSSNHGVFLPEYKQAEIWVKIWFLIGIQKDEQKSSQVNTLPSVLYNRMIFLGVHSSFLIFVLSLTSLNLVPESYLGEKDTLQFLKDYNKEYNFRYTQGTLPFLVTSTPVVEIIFQICRLLDQPSQVRFIAVDLFDR